MKAYQLEIKQSLDYPRCRIYREFVHSLISDRSLHVGNTSHLFHYTVLCCYPHGFGSNLTVFTIPRDQTVAEKAVTNWVNSSGHFQAMIDPRCDTIGVGVTIQNGIAYCYMFAGNPNSHHPYE